MSIKLIKDPIHGNLEFSKFEEYFFYNPLVNRLHNIIQNSMAYRVYPSVRTSRFAHSVGVMHVASRVFQCGISNSNEDVLCKYLEDKSVFLKKYLYEDQDGKNHYPNLTQQKIKEKLKDTDYLEFLLEHTSSFFGNEYIAHSSCYKETFLNNKNYFVVYLILQQSLRLFALTHDLGHLPFSHLAEFAIENLEYSLTLKEQEGLNENEKHVKSIIKNFTTSDDKIHEYIGKNIIRYIFAEISKTIERDASLSSDSRLAFYIYSHLINIALNEIKKKEISALSSLLGIVSGDLEADRMDFILRDGLYSGLVYKTGDIERVIKMFCLCETNDEHAIDKFKFLPAIQSLNDVQEILFDRFRIYKYLVNHHKVKKLDYSVQQVITLLLKEEIERVENLESIAQVGSKNLTSILINCREIFKLDTENTNLAFLLFLQLSDSWLLTILNEKYVNLLIGDEEQQSGKDKLIKLLLEEIFTGCKNFISLWKRDQEYHDFLKSFSLRFLRQDVIDHANKLKNDEKVKNELNVFLSPNEPNENRIIHLIKVITKLNKNWYQHLQEWFDNKGEMVLCCFPKLSLGITDLELIDLKDKNRRFLFREKSKTCSLISNEINSSIQFFVYSYKLSQLNESQLKEKTVDFLLELFLKTNIRGING
jgi:HD superfamily phosphohydrolase